jgi:hypothetical protein
MIGSSIFKGRFSPLLYGIIGTQSQSLYMKNNDRPDLPGNCSSLAVSVTVDEPVMLQALVEKLAHRRYHIGYSRQAVPPGLLAIDTSSIEAYVSGDLGLTVPFEEFSIPYCTCFHFTCVKNRAGKNMLSWVNSLS